MSDNVAHVSSLIAGSRLYHPDPARAAHTNCGSIEAFQALLKRSARTARRVLGRRGRASWSGCARGTWSREGQFPALQVLRRRHQQPHAQPHRSPSGRAAPTTVSPSSGRAKTGRAGSSPTGCWRSKSTSSPTCSRACGVTKGDAVAIFTPNLAEAIVAVLACFRIGALFNTVFSGFSTRSLRDRLDAYAPKVVVTADAGLRRGRVVPLKQTVDEAIEGLSCVEAVVVIRRTGHGGPDAGGTRSLVARPHARRLGRVRAGADGGQRPRHRVLHERHDRQAEGHRPLGDRVRREQLRLRQVPPGPSSERRPLVHGRHRLADACTSGASSARWPTG